MITIISYPNNIINESIAVSDTLESSEVISYINVDVSLATNEDFIEVAYNGETITLLITDECRYTPLNFYFINKDGAQQTITFFKKKTDSLSVTSEDFESDRGQPANGFHQFVKYNTNARKSFKINTGFVDESMNETMQQLYLSDKVWVVENGIVTPVNLKSTSLEFKTRQNDRLINYQAEFNYSFNEINTIW